MTGIIRAPRPEHHYTQIRNEVARDDRLSYRARGVLVRLLSNADGFQMTAADLACEGREGRGAILTALRELRDAGYIRTIKQQDGHGRWSTETFVYDTPQPTGVQKPDSGFPDAGSPDAGFFDAIENKQKNTEQNTQQKNTQQKKESVAAFSAQAPCVDRKPSKPAGPEAVVPGPLPEDWVLPRDWKKWANKARPELAGDLQRIAGRFKAYTGRSTGLADRGRRSGVGGSRASGRLLNYPGTEGRTMRHIGQHLTQGPASRNARAPRDASSSAVSASSLHARMIVNLWERFTHLYGHKFSAAFGESAVNPDGSLTDVAHTWAGGLRGITGAQLAAGLRTCIASGDAWPPSLPEFRAMCLPRSEPRCHQHIAGRADLAYVALPRPPMTPEKREEYLEKMRAALKSPTRQDEG